MVSSSPCNEEAEQGRKEKESLVVPFLFEGLQDPRHRLTSFILAATYELRLSPEWLTEFLSRKGVV